MLKWGEEFFLFCFVLLFKTTKYLSLFSFIEYQICSKLFSVLQLFLFFLFVILPEINC